MNYRRDWTDLQNAVGFAGECARLALPFYSGDQRSVLVDAIECAERHTTGDSDERRHIAAAGRAAAAADVGVGNTVAADAASAAAYAAASADDAIADNAIGAINSAAVGAYWASRAGVDDSEIQIAYARWVTKDLAGDQPIDEETRQAAGAAIVAGDEELARELVQGIR